MLGVGEGEVDGAMLIIIEMEEVGWMEVTEEEGSELFQPVV